MKKIAFLNIFRKSFTTQTSTPVAPQTYKILNGIIDPASAASALLSAKKTKNNNLISIKKIFWHQVYKDIIPSRALFIIQNNNITSSQYLQLKRGAKKLGMTCLIVQNGVFSAAYKSLYKDSFSDLICGPTIVIFSNSNDQQHPDLLKDFCSLLKKFEHALVMGCRFENIVFTAQELEAIAKLPNKNQLHAQLIGLLQMPSQKLIGTLNQSPIMLTSTLNQHLENLKKS